MLGRFTQPDTIVPNPGDAAAFDRYAYVLNNPLRYSDPSGHEPCPTGAWGDCRPNRSYAENYRLARYYVDLNVDWSDIPAEAQAVLKAGGETEGTYSDLAPSVQVQTGLRDPATLAASAVGIGRLVLRLPALLTPCIDDACEAEYRTFDMAVRRADNLVKLQKMGGAVGDALSSRKGFHIGTNVPGAELGLRPGPNGTILLRALGETKVNPGDYINSVQSLLTQQQGKVFAQLNGIITTYPNTWVAQEAQQLINLIKQGNINIVTQ
ncbi:MAG: hypothetical protein R3A44_30200 [Caldilineaceae bacterium]